MIRPTLDDLKLENNHGKHGPDMAAYDNLASQLYGGLRPFIECICGWATTRCCMTWQEVGEEFDAHLKEKN